MTHFNRFLKYVANNLKPFVLLSLPIVITLVVLELAFFLLLLVSPADREPFLHLQSMKSNFHPLFRKDPSRGAPFWPYVGRFRAAKRPLPKNLPALYPEAYILPQPDGENAPLLKPKGEIRVIALGGSTMVGAGASHPAKSILPRLEYFLRQSQLPDAQKIRTINAAHSGYTSTNEMVLLTTRMLAFQPDLIVVLNGYNDFSEFIFHKDLPPFWNTYDDHLYRGFNRVQTLSGTMAQAGYLLSKKLYCLAVPRAWLFSRRYHSHRLWVQNKDKVSPPSFENVMKIYRLNLLTMMGVASSHKIPIIIVLQPNVVYKKPLSPEEEKIMAPNDYFTKYLSACYSDAVDLFRELANSNPTIFYDLSGAFENMDQTIYTDACHYNDMGQDILAQKLAPLCIRALQQNRRQ